MIDPELLGKLCCPESKLGLKEAPAELVASLNEKIAAEQLINRAGKSVAEKLNGGLVRSDGQILYPIRHGIPVMLIDEAIALDQKH